MYPPILFFLNNNNTNPSSLIAECGMRLAAAGYGVFGMDYEGHGKSMGARCYIRSFATIFISVIPLVGINRET